MPFGYYARLSRRDQATYRQSDAAGAWEIPEAAVAAVRPRVEELRAALEDTARAGGDPAAEAGPITRVERASEAICARLSASLGAPAPIVDILAVRPSEDWGELHGLYTTGDEPPRIRVWMRTAKKARVVAFRTFLRTLLHELGHHLDFEVLRLDQSFHTEGFFRRESALFRLLVPEAPGRPGGREAG